MPSKRPIPETFHRVIHKSGAWLKSPAVSPTGVHDERASSDTWMLSRTTNLREASAWSLSRARAIAAMFDGAIVDRVEVTLGTTDHKPGGACDCGCGVSP